MVVTDGVLAVRSVYGSADNPELAAIELIPKPPAAPTVVSTVPVNGATGVSPFVAPRATFSRGLDEATVTSSSVTLRDAGGQLVPASVSYDAPTTSIVIDPVDSLAASATYTARIETSVKAPDGLALEQPATWSFTTSATVPTAPTVTSKTPAAGVTGVASTALVVATFSRAMAAATITAATFTLTGPEGAVAATVSYDSGSTTATLQPTAQLRYTTTYTARLDGAVAALDGAPLGEPVSWSFTTAAPACPCTLLAPQSTPVSTNKPTQDNRTGPGPWSYELGVRIVVGQPMRLTSLRFYKSSLETGLHTGKVWSATGTELARADFTGESASGWQQQALATPLLLEPNTVYVISVNANAYYARTLSFFTTQVVSGPIRSVADGLNGVFGASAGVFPTQTYNSSNYFVDLAAVLDGDPPAPLTVTETVPTAGAVDLDPAVAPEARFSKPIDVSTVSAATFTITGPGGGTAGSVTYDAATQTARLTPASPLAAGIYTARLDASITATDATTLGTPYSWSFTVGSPASAAPTATFDPASGATDVPRRPTLHVVFSRPMDPASLTDQTLRLRAADGAAVPGSVQYDGASMTATFNPSAQLAPAAQYTLDVTAGALAADGTPAVPASATFTTNACPCSLLPITLLPERINRPVRDSRPLPGPWSYEMGVKITVDRPMVLSAIRYYKDNRENGAHTGTVWTSTGLVLAQTTFSAGTASGWQEQALATPLNLQPGSVYVVSVNINAFFVMTQFGLLNPYAVAGARTVADGLNGVYGSAKGVFPNTSYKSTNYFVDAVVE